VINDAPPESLLVGGRIRYAGVHKLLKHQAQHINKTAWTQRCKHRIYAWRATKPNRRAHDAKSCCGCERQRAHGGDAS